MFSLILGNSAGLQLLRWSRLCLLAITGLGLAWAHAENADTELDAQLHEHILYVPVGNWPTVKLQVTVFSPHGAGPFPLAVLNHGKDPGLPRDAKRYRSAYVARYFVSRGYAVALPMLRGFAGSEGTTLVGGCASEREGLAQARDIRQVIEFMASQSDPHTRIDPERIVVSGQSLGGFNTLAVGALGIPGVRGLFNFSGGRNAPQCPAWEQELATAVGHYAERTQVPSIWFYGDNDSRFSAPTWRNMLDHYTRAGGQVDLVDVGNFMDDAHNLLGKVEALPLWTPKADAFLERIRLPAHTLHAELLPAPFPPPTQFAELRDVAAVPLVSDKRRADYQAFLQRAMPRVFAIASNGSTVTTEGGYDPQQRALAICQAHLWRCQIYAVDDQVVWPKP